MLIETLMVLLAIAFGGLLVSFWAAQRIKRMTDAEWREFIDAVERVRNELGGHDVRR